MIIFQPAISKYIAIILKHTGEIGNADRKVAFSHLSIGPEEGEKHILKDYSPVNG